MATLGSVLTDLRSHLDEATASFWSDDELTLWINEGLRDVARRGEVLLAEKTYPVVDGADRFDAPTDMIRIHHVEYVQSDEYRYELEWVPWASMSDIWYTNKTLSGQPQYFTFWGTPGIEGSQLRIYPVATDNQNPGLVVYYYRLPRTVSKADDPLDIPSGWEDLCVLYAEVCARRKEAKDMRWRDAQALYETRLQAMLEVTRSPTDLPSYIQGDKGGVPWWARGDWDM